MTERLVIDPVWLALSPGLAFILDLVVGDPRWLPHPVVIIGRVVSLLEGGLRRLFGPGEFAERLAGVVLTATTVAATYGAAYGLIFLAGAVNPWLGWAMNLCLVSASLAAKSLALAAEEVIGPLKRYGRNGPDEELGRARSALSLIVGRDTADLDSPEVARGAVETVAENTSDGVIAPLLYALLGGAPLALAYKAINTLDSMVGYKNERYRYLGWASARLDDLANFIPARLTACLIIVSAAALGRDRGFDWRGAWACLRRDGHQHPSPNSGWPESAAAGALGVRLGGTNYYGGVPTHRPVIGNPVRALGSETISGAVQLMYASSWLAALAATVALLLKAMADWGVRS